MKEIRFTWVDYLLVAIIVGGLAVGIFLWIKKLNVSAKSASSASQKVGRVNGVSLVNSSIWIDVSGAVEKPGVYQLDSEARVKDVLVVAGGLSSKADREYVSQSLNLAEKLIDGQKIYIPEKTVSSGEYLVSGGIKNNKINVNKASASELMELSGIGEVRAQAIIDGRPYRAIEDLVARKIIPASVFEKIKTKISVY